MPASVAGVVQESSALKGKLVYFVPSYSRVRHSKAELEAIVARLGGKVRIQKGSGNCNEKSLPSLHVLCFGTQSSSEDPGT